MSEDESKKQKLAPCTDNCHLITTNKTLFPIPEDAVKIIKQLCTNYPVTPCFASSILKYYNINIACCVIFSNHTDNLNTHFSINPPVVQKVLLKSKLVKESISKMFTPCNHKGSCYQNKKCTCYVRNIACELSCHCTLCDFTLRCDCKTCDKSCICVKNFRECSSCHESCTNKFINPKKVKIMDSNIAGLGLFADEYIRKNAFVIEYAGEVIGNAEAERRGFFYDYMKLSYLFDFNCDSVDWMTIDSTRIGNESRFINHSGKPNLMARQIKVGGMFRMGFYALRDIKKGEELYFDYKYNEEFKKKYNIHD